MMIKYKYDDYEDFAKFIRTIKNPYGEDFIEGQLYPILAESKSNNKSYVQQRKGTNEVTEFPRDSIGKDFVFSDELGNVQ
jgi:hypothetical protein